MLTKRKYLRGKIHQVLFKAGKLTTLNAWKIARRDGRPMSNTVTIGVPPSQLGMKLKKLAKEKKGILHQLHPIRPRSTF